MNLPKVSEVSIVIKPQSTVHFTLYSAMHVYTVPCTVHFTLYTLHVYVHRNCLHCTVHVYTVHSACLHCTQCMLALYTVHVYTVHSACLHCTQCMFTYTVNVYTVHSACLHCTKRMFTLYTAHVYTINPPTGCWEEGNFNSTLSINQSEIGL